MRDVSIIGTGMVRFGKYPDKGCVELAWPAVKEAVVESGVDKDEIGAAFCGTAGSDGLMLGQRILKTLGLTGIPIANVEGACSSSGIAVRLACMAIKAGECDIALAFGADKMNKPTGRRGISHGEDWDMAYGMAMHGLYAMRAKRYMNDYGVTEEQLAKVSVKSHKLGAKNPYAHIQKEVTLDEVMAARKIADPFTLWHCCPVSDGAAAVVLAASDIAKKYCDKPVKVLASVQTSGKYYAGFRDMTMPEITVRTGKMVYEQTGLGPEDIDLVEVHDAFTINELLYSDALGFSKPGEAIKLVEGGHSTIGGRIPINPSGGLLSRGHPIGPTGAAQIVEVARQLQGRCGARQVDGAKVGMTHVTGGGVSGLDHGACTMHVLAV
jgi:benzoylsuccinyl-CoA thiolase BbsB subunit